MQNEELQKVDKYLGQTLFVENASIIPDGGIIEVRDDNNKWRVVLVSEAKHQGKDIENIEKGELVGTKKDQDLMAAGNAIERSHKNISEIANSLAFRLTCANGRQFLLGTAESPHPFVSFPLSLPSEASDVTATTLNIESATPIYIIK